MKKITFEKRIPFRALAWIGAFGMLVLYGLFVTAGYSWLRYVRKCEQIGVSDVAFFQWKDIRHAIAARHFADARTAWAAKDTQAAYLSFLSGMRNDPDDIAGRLEAVNFFVAVGAGPLATESLEEGLKRAPSDTRLLERAFSLYTATGRDRKALDLWQRIHPEGSFGTASPALRAYRMLATLNVDGAAAAKVLLDADPELRTFPASALVAARVLWLSQERLSAITLLENQLQSNSGVYALYAQLAEWQVAGGMASSARRTAELACERFPAEIAPRLLLIEMLASPGPVASVAWTQSVESFLQAFGGRPEAIMALSELAGRKGWVDLAHTLYVVGANRRVDVAVLAMYYSDALASVSKFREAQGVLAEIEAQTPEQNATLLLLLRRREVLMAAALGDRGEVREHARRLAAAQAGNPDGLELDRARFLRLGLTEAASEMGKPGGGKNVSRP